MLFSLVTQLTHGQNIEKMKSLQFRLPLENAKVEYSKSLTNPISSNFLDSGYVLTLKSIPTFKDELTIIISKSINNGSYIEVQFLKDLKKNDKKHKRLRKKLNQKELEQLEKILNDYHFRKSGRSIIIDIKQNGNLSEISFNDGIMHYGKLTNKDQVRDFEFHQGSASIDSKNKRLLKSIRALSKESFRNSKAIDHIEYIFNYIPY